MGPVLLIFALVCIVIEALLIYGGGLKKFTLKAEVTSKLPVEGMLVLYRPHIGQYKNSWIAFEELKILLREYEMKNKRLVGVYYDPPDIGKNRCRYVVGVVLAEGDVAIKNAASDTKLQDAIKFFKGNGFKEITVPKLERAVYTSFPYRCGILSVWLAVSIVYKVIKETLKKVNASSCGEIMEIYDDNVIHFIHGLGSQHLTVPDFE